MSMKGQGRHLTWTESVTTAADSTRAHAPPSPWYMVSRSYFMFRTLWSYPNACRVFAVIHSTRSAMSRQVQLKARRRPLHYLRLQMTVGASGEREAGVSRAAVGVSSWGDASLLCFSGALRR